MTITAQTGNVEGKQEVYIDNIQIEPATKVNGRLLSEIEVNSLDKNIKLEGAWMKGKCQNAEELKDVEYNDFADLAAKLSGKPANIDMRGCIVKDGDINGMRGDNNSNILVYADKAYEAKNVIYKTGNETNPLVCDELELDEGKSFMAIENFHANNVTLIRSVNTGYNTMCLPFWVSKDEMKASSIATFDKINESESKSVVTFKNVKEVDANVPFIANYNDAITDFIFTDKGVVSTNNALGSTFIGTYTPGYMEGKYGLTTNNTFKKGGAGATTKAFRAYLELSGDNAGAKTLSLDFTDGETTGIESTTASFGNKGVKVYSLQGNLIATASSMSELHLNNGIYIINNKKVIIK